MNFHSLWRVAPMLNSFKISGWWLVACTSHQPLSSVYGAAVRHQLATHPCCPLSFMMTNENCCVANCPSTDWIVCSLVSSTVIGRSVLNTTVCSRVSGRSWRPKTRGRSSTPCPHCPCCAHTSLQVSTVWPAAAGCSSPPPPKQALRVTAVPNQKSR